MDAASSAHRAGSGPPGRSLPRRPRARAAAQLTAALLAVLAAAISAATATAQPARGSAPITVLAAASLADVLPRIDGAPRYSFAGSDTLAGQIRLGAPADVFLSANTELPRQLFAEGLVERPVTFTANALVLVVPRANTAGIRTVADLRRKGLKLLVGTATVPVGAYTRRVLRNLALTSVLGNVVSEESDTRSILGKVALGEADAGFVYATDARAVAGKVTVIPLPARAQPAIRYGAAVIRSSGHRARAVAFVDRLLSREGQARFAAAGFVKVPGIPARLPAR